MSSGFANAVFSATPASVTDFADAVLRHIDPARIRRVLDIGCGTGQHLLHLRERLSHAHFTGIDLSAENCEKARRAAEAAGVGDAVEFITGDYLEMTLGPFDLVVSQSTLHLITDPGNRLFAKIAKELAPGGTLAFSMPDGSGYNQALWAVRRVLRGVRCGLTDRLIFTLGKMLHRNVPDELLRERVAYMYMLPHRYVNPRLRKSLARDHSLSLVAEMPSPHAGAGQPKHRLCVWRKPAGAM